MSLKNIPFSLPSLYIYNATKFFKNQLQFINITKAPTHEDFKEKNV